MQQHIDPSAIATAGMRAGSPVLESYQEHSTIPVGSPPLCQSGNPLAAASSLGTRVGSTGMIPRLNSLHNGRAQDPQDRRACALCFLTFEGVCTLNLPLKARPLTLSSTVVFFAI